MDVYVVLWENWHEQVKQLFVGIHGHQKKTLALCVLGIILSGSAVLQRLAESLHLEDEGWGRLRRPLLAHPLRLGSWWNLDPGLISRNSVDRLPKSKLNSKKAQHSIST